MKIISKAYAMFGTYEHIAYNYLLLLNIIFNLNQNNVTGEKNKDDIPEYWNMHYSN